MHHEPSFSLDTLIGTWYISKTTFPFWKHHYSPQIVYEINQQQPERLLDTISYVSKHGKPKIIKGASRPDSTDTQMLLWRGRQWFSWWLTSNWQIVAQDREMGWVLVYFQKTWLTPQGWDLYTRNKNFDYQVWQTIYQIHAESIQATGFSQTDFFSPLL